MNDDGPALFMVETSVWLALMSPLHLTIINSTSLTLCSAIDDMPSEHNDCFHFKFQLGYNCYYKQALLNQNYFPLNQQTLSPFARLQAFLNCYLHLCTLHHVGAIE